MLGCASPGTIRQQTGTARIRRHGCAAVVMPGTAGRKGKARWWQVLVATPAHRWWVPQRNARPSAVRSVRKMHATIRTAENKHNAGSNAGEGSTHKGLGAGAHTPTQKGYAAVPASPTGRSQAEEFSREPVVRKQWWQVTMVNGNEWTTGENGPGRYTQHTQPQGPTSPNPNGTQRSQWTIHTGTNTEKGEERNTT